MFASAGVILVAALLSIALSGHDSGQNNNIFHLPIMQRLYDEPQFQTDVFIQSLRYYASGFWMLFAGTASDGTALAFFLPLHIASRFVFFAGVLMMAAPLGLTQRRQTYALLIIVAMATTLRGNSPAGDGDLFIASFTQSELANGTVLMALALAARRQFGWAAVGVGVTFFINAFMAVWLAAPWLVLAALALQRREISLAGLARQILFGALVFIPLAAPVIANVFAGSHFPAAQPFDYRQFLDEYWPYHFLVWDVPKTELVKFAAEIAAGCACAAVLPAAARRLVLVLIACFAGIWVIGTGLPLATSSPSLLNLHLLRSSSVTVILITLSLAALAVQLLSSETREDRLFWGPLLLILLLIQAKLVPLAVVLILARAWCRAPQWAVRPAFAGGIIAIAACAACYRCLRIVAEDRTFAAEQRQWVSMAAWAHDNTAGSAVFLLPAANIHPGALKAADPEEELLAQGDEVFRSFSHRQSWVGDKEGAAVMWHPSYYGEWRSRMAEVLQLRDLQDRLRYAREHEIGLVVDACDGANAPAPVFRAGRLCAYKAEDKT